ncbi:MAG: DEAD/DEAH box helicase [Fimbriimonadaceae bacterium]|nr:DEAD/DEAH box helicase [Fimbriimonadaceae bacterium]QYK58715.1 MAG: DEAD/DEAH box helicase [Fimbriimonadaceae bacterium]
MKPSTQFSGFAALGVPADVCASLADQGIVVPTLIQSQAIPPVIDGRDVVGLAQTGTGKTLAFGLPLLMRLGPEQTALVLAPTRELAQQIAQTFQNLRVRCALVVGGLSMLPQEKALRNKPKVIVATPGRLMDHMERGNVRWERISTVVLDEADRMLDMGFAPSIKRILDRVPTKRQTLLFSATFPHDIASLAAQYLKDPVRVEATPAGAAPSKVEQELVYVAHEEKPTILSELLVETRGTVLVFSRTRHGARKLTKSLRSSGHRAAEIHSDRTPSQRREALEGFKEGRYRVLVATDIAARGIDVKDIELVVNYDVPEKPEDYVHRIGRTGRAGSAGRAITLALPDQASDVRAIEKLLGVPVDVSRRSTAAPLAGPRPPLGQPKRRSFVRPARKRR